MSLDLYKVTSENESLRKQLRLALRHKEELRTQLRTNEQVLDHYRQSVDNSPNAIFSIDREGYITTWNPSSSSVFQYDTSILGTHFRKLLQYQVQVTYLEKEILQGGKVKTLSNIDLTYRCKDGGTREMVSRIYPVENSSGDIHGFVFANTDVTERHKIQRELQLYRNHLEDLVDERTRKLQEEIQNRKAAQNALQTSYDAVLTILDSMDLAIQVTSMERDETIFMNNQLQSLVGVGIKVDPGYSLFAPLTSEDRLVEQSDSGSAYKGVRDWSETVFDSVLGRWYVLYECVMAWIDGRMVRLQVATDITERKQADDERQRVEKLESLGVLAGGIAHDFNNLLTGIMGSISLLKAQTESTNSSRSLLDSAEKAASRATSLTRQLLAFSKGGEPIRAVISLAAILKEEVEFALSGSAVRAVMNIDTALAHTEADSGQLCQVFHNLALNAQQAMADGGELIVSAENSFLEEGTHSTGLPAGPYIRIEFADTGPGMALETQGKIFDPYFSTKATGKGLGLATVHKIIAKHHGKISVDSIIGEGTTFTIYLPSSDRVAPVTAEKEVVRTVSQGKILLMDDDEIIRDVAAAILNQLGYDVDSVSDGEAMLARYAASQSEERVYDAVILDLTIQGGMGGEEAVKKLVQINPEVKAIASSGYSDSAVMSDWGRYGFSAILQKPYKVDEMEETLGQLLRK